MPNHLRYKVVVSDRAKRMLGGHIRFLAMASAQAARRTKEHLLAAIRSLATLPERFPFFEGEDLTANKYRKMLVDNRYIILYYLKDCEVYVEHILDCRTDYRWLL